MPALPFISLQGLNVECTNDRISGRTSVSANFVRFLAYFGQNLVAVATCLRTLQSEMSSSDWPTTKYPVISNYILVVSRRNASIAIVVQNWLQW